MQGRRTAGIGHQVDPGGIKQGGTGHGPARPETIGNAACNGLGEPPDDVLDGNHQGEGFPAPAQIKAHGGQKQPESLANTDGQGQDQTTT